MKIKVCGFAFRPSKITKKSVQQRLNLRSVEDLKRELLQVQARGDLNEESLILNNIAKLLESAGKYRRAVKYHSADYDLCKVCGDVEGMSAALGNLVYCYLKYSFVSLPLALKIMIKRKRMQRAVLLWL